jgi:hypothetical protein
VSKQVSSPDPSHVGESCGGCGCALAIDQRYCLNCGRRRGEPRLDYLRYLVPERAPADGAVPAGRDGFAQPGTRRDASPILAVGGIALLGLMLLVGVLVGRGGDSATPQPAVVQVPASGAATHTTAAAQPGAGSLDQKKAKGGHDKVVQASTADLQALENASGADYAEQSKKLPDTIATPGEAPPKDNVKPGGGSSGTTIK